MTPSVFTTLIRSFSTAGTRRRLVPLLAAFPLGGVLITLSDEKVAAEHPNERLGRRTRQRNRKQRNKRRQNNNQNNGNNNPGGGGGSGGGGGGGGGTHEPSPAPTLGNPASCEDSSDCPVTMLCNGGACVACDVCQSGCTFNNLHAAIDSPTQPSTIYICPGTYDPVVIARSLTLIGAGDANVQSITTLQGQSGFTSVVTIVTDNAVVTLQGLIITGGNSPEGGGIFNNGTLTMTDVTVSGNTANNGGGIYNKSATITLTQCSVTGNTANASGGGICNAGSGITLADCSVTGNTATDDGGGIYNGGGPVALQSGTMISGNSTGNGNSSVNCGGPGPYAG